MATKKNAKGNTGLILLAAGESKRFGRPKQLLTYNGKPLLQYNLQTIIASRLQPIVVVLGAYADKIQDEIKEKTVYVVVNKDWQEGMSSSIRSGIKTITKISPDVEGVILMVCDQPYVTSDLLNELVAAHKKTGKQIVACSYDDTFGPPAFFHHSLFDELLQLKGDIGARSIVKQHADMVDVIPFPEGTFDIDTEADYDKLKQQ